ncbi:hypothetical protein AO286_26230 [Pseudomonas syringae]|uniref:saccharopine dehydrogenase NADP-binding domain-containing protein n=1 Tax=Pseudomonas syringae TaxID=317 RepID=UPI000C0A53E9|nr:saccharopine dehydrogenase NADP-binding domain-containing protein [Pseudomonas syringae]PHN66713.1 hypothetical protein AO286_26230 [Pseudomonas syringae]
MNGIENIVIVGFGSIAQALMPLLVERYSVKITIFEKDVDATRKNIAGEYGASLIQKMITPKNFEHTLAPLLTDKTFLLNLAVSVSSEALITLAQHHDSLYLGMLRSTCYAAAASRNLPGTQRYLLKMA